MKPIHYHLLNSAIAGGLVFLGSLTPLLAGDFNFKTFGIGACLGIVTGSIIFLNKFNEWFDTQDPCPKIFNFV